MFSVVLVGLWQVDLLPSTSLFIGKNGKQQFIVSGDGAHRSTKNAHFGVLSISETGLCSFSELQRWLFDRHDGIRRHAATERYAGAD